MGMTCDFICAYLQPHNAKTAAHVKKTKKNKIFN